MRGFLRALLILSPKFVYLVALASGQPQIGAALALVLAIGANVRRGRSGRLNALEAALAVGLFLLAVGGYFFPDIHGHGAAIIFATAAAGAAIGSGIGRPWTEDVSAAEYPELVKMPLFGAVNRFMSTAWGIAFAWIAAAHALALHPLAVYLPLVVWGSASLFLPDFLVGRGLHRMREALDPRPWPAPALRGPERPPVIVIGAGVGGLTAAALLARAGIGVRVFEQHTLSGGFAHCWTRKAPELRNDVGRPAVFRFDSGVHDFSGVHPGGPIHGVLERLGRASAIDWRPLHHGIWRHGSVHDIPGEWHEHVGATAARHPGESEGIRTFFAETRAIYDAMYASAAHRGGIPFPPASGDELMAFARRFPTAVEWMPRPWCEFVARHIRSPAARDDVSFLSLYLTHDVRTLTVERMIPLFGYLLHGGAYPAGGSGAFSATLQRAVEANGGEVHLRSRVMRVLMDRGRAAGVVVRDHRGQEMTVEGSAVVLNGDVPTAARHLLPPGAWPIDDVGPACSAHAVHLALRGTHLGAPIIHAETASGAVHIVSPSSVDPSAAPEGFSTLELLALVPPGEARSGTGPEAFPPDLSAFRRSAAYLQDKRAACDALVASAAHVVPDLAERIVMRHDASPVTFRRYGWTTAGSIYGTDRHVPTRTPIPGLVVAGSATLGAGIEAAVISGARAAEALLPGLLDSASTDGGIPAAA